MFSACALRDTISLTAALTSTMANSDDEDAFLYGSDDDKTQTQPVVQEKSGSPEKSLTDSAAGEDNIAADDDEEEEEYLSEDDIDFIIGDAPTVAVDESEEKSTQPATLKEGTTIVAKQQSEEALSTIDVNAVAEYEGKPLTQLDLETLKEKPWRAPGVDISDYFNYGFDEFSWTYYCSKQDKLRGEFNPQKVFNQLMGKNGGMPPMMPGMPPMMPGMPPMMPGQMPPMPPNFKFNMPPPPPPPGQNNRR